LQRNRLATWTPAGHRYGIHHFSVGHVLQVGVTVPPAETGYSTPEEPEAEDQGQEPA